MTSALTQFMGSVYGVSVCGPSPVPCHADLLSVPKLAPVSLPRSPHVK